MNWRSISKTVVILGEQPNLSLQELADASRLEPDLVQDLADMGVLAPVTPGSLTGEGMFPSRSLDVLRSAARLRQAFDLNTGGLVLALTYAERIHQLESELKRLRCLLGE